MNILKISAQVAIQLGKEPYYPDLIGLVLKVLADNNVLPKEGINPDLCSAVARVMSSEIVGGICLSIINQDGLYAPKSPPPVSGPSDIRDKNPAKDWGKSPVSN